MPGIAQPVETAVQDLQKSNLADQVAFFEAENTLLRRALLKAGLGTDSESIAQRITCSRDGAQGQLLMPEEKLELLSLEFEAAQAAVQEAKDRGEETLHDLAAHREESNARRAEIAHDMYELKRDVIHRSGKKNIRQLSAHHILKYLDGRLHRKDELIEKLQIKCSAIKAQVGKAEQQVQQREALGEALMPVDFDQLVIENRQYSDRLQTSNSELLGLKATTGRVVQVLSDYKAALSEVMERGAALEKGTAARQDQLDKFLADRTAVCHERDAAARLLRRITGTEHDSELPQIMDMIQVKADVAELEDKVADWKRKLEIADMDATRSRRLYQTAMTSS